MWLQEMRRMSLKAESDDLVFCTEVIKLWRTVAAVAIKDKQSVRPSRM
jgi:hypothetical protein